VTSVPLSADLAPGEYHVWTDRRLPDLVNTRDEADALPEVFPNPAHDEVFIRSSSGMKAVRLVDLQGRTLLSENLQEVIIKASVRTREKYKQARLGQEGDLIQQVIPKLEFFNNYNTVESYMLISAILVNISALMFESSELTGPQSDSLTYTVILIVTISILYFSWVLFSELWVAFYPEKPLPLLCIKPKPKVEEEEKLEEVDFVKFRESENPMQPQKSGESSVQLQMKLETAEQMIQQQQAEIARLKKQGSVANVAVQQAFAAPVAQAQRKPAPKVKKDFGVSASGTEFAMESNPMRRGGPSQSSMRSPDDEL